MAGSLTITKQELRDVNKYTLAWLSDAAGAVSGNLTDYISGTIHRVVFNPDGGGTQPSDLYDVTLLDQSGVDVLAGQGANLSNSTTTAVCPGVALDDGTTTSVVPCVIDDTLELTVAAAGDSKGGVVVLYVKP